MSQGTGHPMRTRSLLVVSAAGMLTLGMALPASAAPGQSTATVTVTGGALSITVPTDAGSLGTLVNTVAGGTISGPLGQVQVNDARSAAAGWVASVIYTANNPGNLTGASPAVTATGITGDNSATWNPTINVAVPGGTVAAVYSATITHSVV
jgi:hypothetical protein